MDIYFVQHMTLTSYNIAVSYSEYLGIIEGQIIDISNLPTYIASRKKAITFQWSIESIYDSTFSEFLSGKDF